MSIIGGRSVHPVNTCVGGFYCWPNTDELHNLLPELEWGLEASRETVRWATNLPFPDLQIFDYEFVAIHHPDEYGILEGDVLSSNGKQIPVEEFEKSYLETHVRHSNALHSHNTQGQPYITGPMARLNLNYEQLGVEAQEMI